MGKLKNYLGLDSGDKAQPEEHNFSVAYVYTGIAIFMIIGLAVMQWPEQGIPSPLHRLNPELTGGTHWVSAENLSQLTVVAAWAGFVWKFLVYLATAMLLHRVAKAFYRKADFTATALATLRAVPSLLLVGMFGNQFLLHLVARGIQETHGLPSLEQESAFFSDQGMVTILFIAALFFIEGALRRGLTLQEDTDATI